MNAYDVLETRSTDNDFCRLILNFMVNHPLEKYTKVRLLNIEDALMELNEIAKQLTDLTKLLQQMEMEKENDKQFEFENVLTIFMVHISCIFARIMVEILIYLSFEIEPHINFWENQYKLNHEDNKYKIYKNLNKIYSLSISSRRARIFKKLLTDLHVQTGHIQWWFWGLIKLKNDTNSTKTNENILQFIAEMKELFESQSQSQSQPQSQPQSESQTIMDSMIQTISFADSFVVKMQKDIKIWGMPSHWRRNYKIYSFCTISVIFTSFISYYKWSEIKYITNHSLKIMKNFFIEHFYEPLDEILTQIFYFDTDKKKEYESSYEIEKETLKDMIASFEAKHLNIQHRNKNDNDLNMTLIMDQYKKDIESPISSATKGSLLTNIFIQVQKMKVEISKLMIDVDNIMDSNKINMEIFATIPFISLLYLLQQIWSNQNGSNKLKKESKKELRFIFRSVYSILIKNYEEKFVEYQEYGLILFLMYKCFFWAKRNLNAKIISNDEFKWFQYDINNFIRCEYSVKQKLELLRRMETYYL